jgi:hypothetical protein
MARKIHIQVSTYPKHGIVYIRGGHLPELREPHLSSHFGQEPHASAVGSALTYGGLHVAKDLQYRNVPLSLTPSKSMEVVYTDNYVQ